MPVPTKFAAVAVEQHVAGLGAVGQGDGRADDRRQLAVRAAAEAHVIAAAIVGVGHIHQVTMDRDTDGQDAGRAMSRNPAR